MTDRLVDTTGGLWVVATESSTYLFDLDDRTATRHPGTGTPDEDQPVVVAELRRDGEQIPLIKLDRCQVGERLVAVLDIWRDGTSTVRESTLVQTISRVDRVKL